MTIIKNTENDAGKFLPTKVLSLADIAAKFAAGETVEVPESDLLIQDKDLLVQFRYVKPEEDKKYEIKPGTFILSSSMSGIELSKIELKKRTLLETINNTKSIMHEAKTFFSKLHIYEQENRPKKRGILLYSSPGLGKSSAIEKVCMDLLAEDPGTCVVIWPTSDIDAEDLNNFLSNQSEYADNCTRMVLIMEDIGGGESDEFRGRNPVSSGLLNILDGIGVVFKLPTLIIATTNHPEQLLESLADRPGRFDLYQELLPPSAAEKILLMEFISKRNLTEDEKTAITKKGTEAFSIAHLEEVRIRSLLHDKSYGTVVDELINHTKIFKKDFSKKGDKSVGLM